MAQSTRTKSLARSVRREARKAPPKVTLREQTRTLDAFQNLAARTGFGADNQLSFGTYGYFPITKMRATLDFAYRSSWVCRAACQVIAEDMTKNGFDLGSDIDPEQIDIINQGFNKDWFLWDKLRETIQWARLYGGAGAFIMIDGAKPEEPLDFNKIGKDSFCGLLPLDRWLVDPSVGDLVTDQRSPNFGKPKFYTATGDTPLRAGTRIHHSRFLRFDGDDLSWYQKLAENLWSMSVLEPIWDRLICFDQTTAGAAQLVNRAYLRTYKITGWRQIVGSGGKLLEAQLSAIDWMRRFMQNEGINVIDATDEIESMTYAFAGLDSILIQMGQQISGALGIPLVKLFGQSPAGLNSTGESDIKMYDDTIRANQERKLRTPVETLLRIVSISKGIKLPEGFGWTFRSLRILQEEEKAQYAGMISTQVLQGFEAGLINQAIALKELKQQSQLTGIWTNITDEDIEQAENAPPPGMGMPGMPGDPNQMGGEGGGQFLPGQQGEATRQIEPPKTPQIKAPTGSFLPDQKRTFLPQSFTKRKSLGPDESEDEAVSEGRPRKKPIFHLHVTDQDMPGKHVKFQGHPIVIEVDKGMKRYEGSSGGATMAAPYGYFTGTTGLDNDAVDVFLGDNESAPMVFVIDQGDPDTKKLHQHKVFLGFDTSADAYKTFQSFYADGRGPQRMLNMKEYTTKDFDKWLDTYRDKLSA